MKKFNLRALASGLATAVAMTCLSGVSAFAAAQKVGEAAQAIMPTRVQAVEALERANDKWITGHPNHGRSFWDNAAYHVGNMEAYFTTGIELYRNYSEAWSIQNNWKGATSNNKSAWRGGASTGGYGEGQEWVLFGDWQICFQTYIDLYNDELMASKGAIKDDTKVARALEVMSYQMSTGKNDWWWWADSLFMAMPIMSKMYVLTGDLQYLDKQYEWFKWAAEDVEGGTKDGMWDEEYQLFHRDGKYIYPDHKTAAGKKNFWARGSGWVFAGLARVLSDMPTDYEHRDYFLDKYTQMANGVKNSQQPEGFWSRSMIDRAEADGFESSGTSFFTYGLAWGINSGYLDRDTYLDAALKGWYFLYNTALQDDGTVGYVQPIGENPRQSLNIGGRDTQNFGVGAFLLASSEISKLAGGVYGDQTNNNDIYPYIMRKLAGEKYVMEVNTAHVFESGIIHHHDENNHNMQTYRKDGNTMIPVITIKNYFKNCTVNEAGDTVTVTRTVKRGAGNVTHTVVVNNNSTAYTVDGAAGVLPTAVENKDGYICVPVRQIMEGLGYEVWYSGYSGTSQYVANNPMDGLLVISEKTDPFFACDANAVEMLRWMLEVNHHYPERPAQSPKSYTVTKPMQAATEAYGTQVPLTTTMLSASATPEAQNNVYQTIDNNVQTRWAAQGSQHMDIDLGVPMQIACVGVRMMSYTEGRVINYGVQISSDNTTWTSVFNGTSVANGGVWEYPKVDGKVARYIRINVNGSSVGDWASVADVAVFQGDANSPKANGVTGSGTSGGVVTQGVTSSATGTKVTLNAGMVKASAEPETQNPGRNAVDGNAGTVWAAEGSANLVIDLGSTAVVSTVGVQMKQYDDTRTVNYGVEVSENGSAYTSYFNGACAPAGGVMEYIPVAANARYVRINVNGNSISNWASVAEVEVYTGGTANPATGQVQQGTGPVVTNGSKIALNAGMVKASAEPESQNPASAAVDGNASTVWAAEGNQNLVIDLGSAQTIGSVGVQMKQYDDTRTVNYGVEVSEDGSNYTSVFNGACAPGGGVMESQTVGRSARYIRINVNGNSISAWASVAEVEVYSGTVTGGTAGGAVGGATGSIVSKPIGNKMSLKSAATLIVADKSFPASAAIDGNRNTSWKGMANQSIVVETANEKTVTSVGVRSAENALSYTISVSADGSNWTPVYSGTGAADATAYHACQAKGKYVMITLAAEGKVAEVEVYGAE